MGCVASVGNGEGIGADIFVGWVDADGAGHIRDYSTYTLQKVQPTLDGEGDDQQGTQDVTLEFAEVDSTGQTTIGFSRAVDTGDNHRDRPIRTDGPMHLLWAYNAVVGAMQSNDGARFVKHETVTRGHVELDLGQPSECHVCPEDAAAAYDTLAASCASNGWPPKDGLVAEQGETCMTNADSTWQAHWELSDDQTSVRFDVKSDAAVETGWVAIGFSNDQNMVDSDCVIAFQRGVTDRWAIEHHRPLIDASQDISDWSVSQGNGSYSFSFTRPLRAVEADSDVSLEQPVYIMWAYGPKATIGERIGHHTAKGVSTHKVDIRKQCGGLTAAQTTTSRALIVHGALMAVSWFGLLGTGMSCARYRSSWGTGVRRASSDRERFAQPWFPWHRGLNAVGIGVALTAFSIALVDLRRFERGVHPIVGTVALLICMIMLPLGACRPAPQSSRRRCWYLVHRSLGVFALLLAFVAVPLGVKALLGKVPVKIWGVEAAGILLGIVGVVLAEVHRCSARKSRHVFVEMAGMSREGTDGATDDTVPTATEASAVALDVDAAAGREDCGLDEDGYPPSRPAQLLLGSALLVLGVLLPASIAYFGTAAAGELDGGNVLPAPDSLNLCFHFEEWEAAATETDYVCYGFQFPTNQLYHATRFQPLVDEASIVHHMILYTVQEDQREEGFFPCSTMPRGSQPTWVWAPGQAAFEPPEDVGFPVGGTESRWAVLQIHYNNPNRRSGLRDSSGVWLRLTSELRPIEGGFFPAGIKTNTIEIPAGKTGYGMVGEVTISEAKLAAADVSEPPVTLFSGINHMHLLGRRMWVELERDGVRLQRPADVGGGDMLPGTRAWDFNFQHFQPVDPEVELQAGDRIVTRCVWENTMELGWATGNAAAQNGEVVTGCEATDCEMCLTYFAYYPKVSRGFSFMDSTPTVFCDDDAEQTHCDHFA